jgi:hypothetical protein
MSNLLQKLEAKITSKKIDRDILDREIAELEIAMRVLREMADELPVSPNNGSSSLPMFPTEKLTISQQVAKTDFEVSDQVSKPDQGPMDLTGKTMVEAAIQILAENSGGPLHYTRIADLALERGYTSGRNTNSSTLRISFGQVLRRESAKDDCPLLRAGDGSYMVVVDRDQEATSGREE